MEGLLVHLAELAQRLSEAAAIVVVTFGSVEAFVKLLWMAVTPGATHGERKVIWRGFGMWLLLGLEFELAGDIVGSIMSPTWKEIGELAAIAVIRTFLNYFLERDLEQAEKSNERAMLAASSAEPAPITAARAL